MANDYISQVTLPNNTTYDINDTTKLPLTGGTLTGDLILNSASGNSPSIFFTRDNTLTDWRIVVTSGKLSFQSATDASTWTERGYFRDNSGNFVATGAITATTYNNYTLGAACEKAVTDSTSAGAIGTGTSLTTERDVYYGLPTINGAHNYNSSTTLFAPTQVGTSGYVLKSQGSGEPEWEEEYSVEIEDWT